MDPRDRADAMLARARARRGYVVTPDDAVSPMDAASTMQIPRAVVSALDESEEPATSSMPAPNARGRTPAPRTHHEDIALATPDVTQPLPATDADGTEETRTEGIVPTVQQSRPNMRSLSQRLDGE